MASALILAALTGCKKADADTVITVGATPEPHAAILNLVAEDLSKDGYTLKVIEFTDYVTPNEAVESGEIDANYFQHLPYMDSFNKEKDVISDFDKYNLKYTPQKTFEDCRDINKLPFDAFLEDYNIAIEYDGEGHYYPIPRYKGDDGTYSFERAKLHDKIKNKYCENNSIKLIRIPYWEQNNIEEYLISELSKYDIKVA